MVLLDLKFGEQLVGIELLRVIKQRRRDLPILILTGMKDDQTLLDVWFGDPHSRPNGYLVKPLDEMGWKRILGALFPTPERAVLVRQGRFLRLFNANGMELTSSPIQLDLKHWTLVCCFMLKRWYNREGVSLSRRKGAGEGIFGQRRAGGHGQGMVQKTIERDMKAAMQAARSGASSSEVLDIDQYSWDDRTTRIEFSKIKNEICTALGHGDWELIKRRDDGKYALSSTLTSVQPPIEALEAQ